MMYTQFQKVTGACDFLADPSKPSNSQNLTEDEKHVSLRDPPDGPEPSLPFLSVRGLAWALGGRAPNPRSLTPGARQQYPSTYLEILHYSRKCFNIKEMFQHIMRSMHVQGNPSINKELLQYRTGLRVLPSQPREVHLVRRLPPPARASQEFTAQHLLQGLGGAQ